MEKEYRCFECSFKSKNAIFRKSTRRYEGNGYDFELDVETPYCEKCGSPIYDKEIEEEIREKAHKMIEEQIHITKSEF